MYSCGSSATRALVHIVLVNRIGDHVHLADRASQQREVAESNGLRLVSSYAVPSDQATGTTLHDNAVTVARRAFAFAVKPKRLIHDALDRTSLWNTLRCSFRTKAGRGLGLTIGRILLLRA